MGNICPPNKNSNGGNGRSTAYINETGGVKSGGQGNENQNSFYPIVNIANGNIGHGNNMTSQHNGGGSTHSSHHQNFQMNGYGVNNNGGLLAPSSSSIMNQNSKLGNNVNDGGEKPNFIALFDYEQVLSSFTLIKDGYIKNDT